MYYQTYSVMLKPGERFAGVEQLKKMAAMLKEKYGVASMVLSDMLGKVYLHHLVIEYENLAQMEEVADKLVADEDYLAWFKETRGLFKWKEATSRLYRRF